MPVHCALYVKLQCFGLKRNNLIRTFNSINVAIVNIGFSQQENLVASVHVASNSVKKFSKKHASKNIKNTERKKLLRRR